jgi:hypothetical protein
MSKKLVQLLVVSDSELEMARNDTCLLVIAGCVASKLENLSSQVLENRSEVDGGTGTDALGIIALAEETMDTTDRESEASLGRATVKALVDNINKAIYRANFWRRNLRLRVLAARRLATGFAAASHFD